MNLVPIDIESNNNFLKLPSILLPPHYFQVLFYTNSIPPNLASFQRTSLFADYSPLTFTWNPLTIISSLISNSFYFQCQTISISYLHNLTFIETSSPSHELLTRIRTEMKKKKTWETISFPFYTTENGTSRRNL